MDRGSIRQGPPLGFAAQGARTVNVDTYDADEIPTHWWNLA